MKDTYATITWCIYYLETQTSCYIRGKIYPAGSQLYLDFTAKRSSLVLSPKDEFSKQYYLARISLKCTWGAIVAPVVDRRASGAKLARSWIRFPLGAWLFSPSLSVSLLHNTSDFL